MSIEPSATNRTEVGPVQARPQWGRRTGADTGGELLVSRIRGALMARAGDVIRNPATGETVTRSAVIARAHLDDYALPFPPLRVQRALFWLLAPLGRALGYSARYP